MRVPAGRCPLFPRFRFSLALVVLGTAMLPALRAGAEESDPGEPPPPRRIWFQRHHAPRAGWSPERFRDHCTDDTCAGDGTWDGGVGSTALVLLAYSSMGATAGTDVYGEDVSDGLVALRAARDADGLHGDRRSERFVRDHALAVLALGNQVALTLDSRLREEVRAGVQVLLAERSADGGWRTGARDERSDAVTTYWATAALAEARDLGIPVDDGVFRDAVRWLDRVTEAPTGIVLEQGREPVELCAGEDYCRTERATAAGLALRLLCGEPLDADGPIAGAKKYLEVNRPRADPTGAFVDPEYWYLGTASLYWLDGDTWRRWNEAMKKAIVETMVVDGGRCADGSWSPLPGATARMGRVGTTAFMVLNLTTYYRWSRCFCDQTRWTQHFQNRRPLTLRRPELDLRVRLAWTAAAVVSRAVAR